MTEQQISYDELLDLLCDSLKDHWKTWMSSRAEVEGAVVSDTLFWNTSEVRKEIVDVLRSHVNESFKKFMEWHDKRIYGGKND